MDTFEYTMGSATNNVPIIARGGNSTATPANGGNGGDGGDIEVRTSNWSALANTGATSTNTADIDVTGGNASDDGTHWERSGNGGDLEVTSVSDASNSGALNANAGTGGQGGNSGGGFEVYSSAGEANNSGDVAINGSEGLEWGGSGGWTWLEGVTSTNSGEISANGGNATNVAAPVGPYTDTWGGSGGWIEMFGQGLDGAVNNTGTLSNAVGTGTQDGEIGCIRLGPFNIEGLCD